jgi:mannonate dehydratase
MLARYRGTDKKRLQANLARFLGEVVPMAEKVAVRMVIHPDDPPRPLLGLPRITSTAEHIAFILDAVPSPANGLTLCTGSLGARPANDLPAITLCFADRINLVHLRNRNAVRMQEKRNGAYRSARTMGTNYWTMSVRPPILAIPP